MSNKKNRTGIIIGVSITIVSIAVIAFVLQSNKKKNQEKIAIVSDTKTEIVVKTTTAKNETLESFNSFNGTFAAYKQLDYSSDVAGRVLSVKVREGELVVAGQELAIIKSDAVSVDLENAQAVFNNAVKDKERFENAYKSGGVTQQQLDQINLALKNAESRLEQIKLRYSDTKIKSTINGYVNKRYVEEGAFVGMGSPLFEIVDISKLNLKISVNEVLITQLKVGDKVEVTASAMPGKTFIGTVRFIAAKADLTMNFPVEIELDNRDKTLKAGMYGSAIFKSGNIETTPILTIPRTAFVGSVNSGEVYTIQNGKATLIKVVPGRIFGDKVEIINGLTEGATVITSGQINLFANAPVTVVK